MKNRYLVFAGDTYYPGGGSDDFKCAFDNLDEAILKAKEFEYGGFDWATIFDTIELKDVKF